jgi:fatty acid desaturase
MSTTMPYQRDNFAHFLVYWMRYLVGINIELPYRTFMRRSFADAVVLVLKLVSNWTFAYFAYGVYPHATLWLIIMPYILASFALMFGNFSQHLFIDQEKFDDNMLLSFNCIGEYSNNHKIFNDGYHIVHHVNSKMHWSKMASEFGDNWQEYDKQGALCFKGIDFFGVGILVMTGQLEKLARDHYVGTDENVVETMKARLKPIKV